MVCHHDRVCHRIHKMSDTVAPASRDPIVVYDSDEEEAARQLGTHSNRTKKKYN